MVAISRPDIPCDSSMFMKSCVSVISTFRFSFSVSFTDVRLRNDVLFLFFAGDDGGGGGVKRSPSDVYSQVSISSSPAPEESR